MPPPRLWQILTACEREFGVVMPHAALNDVSTVDDAVRYWEARLQSITEEQERAARHYTVVHPPNVVIGGKGRGAIIDEWRAKYARPHEIDDSDGRALDGDDDDDDALEERLGQQDEAERMERQRGRGGAGE
jgi:hypothetical protein